MLIIELKSIDIGGEWVRSGRVGQNPPSGGGGRGFSAGVNPPGFSPHPGLRANGVKINKNPPRIPTESRGKTFQISLNGQKFIAA